MLSTPKSRRNLFLASSLLDGLEDNDLRQVETLLSVNDADPNILIPNRGVSPFHLVIGDESEEFAEQATKLFLRHGGDPNVKAVDGMTPVHIAAAWGRISVLELLLANGGDPLSLDDEGRSPFHYAFDGAFYNAVAILGKYCGVQNEEEEEPKFKITLDKILVNRGNVVAEYVPSSKLHEISTKTNETFSEETEISSSDEKTLNSDWLRANNVTFRRNRKFEEDKTQELNLTRENADEEKIIVGKIIRRLSNSLTSETTSSDVYLKNLKNVRSTSACKRVEKKEINDFARRKMIETSIVSKSPNCRLQSIKDKTPRKKFENSEKKRNEKSEKNEKTSPSRAPNDLVKSANSTPRQKTCSRLYEAAKKTTERYEKSSNCNNDKKLTPKHVENDGSKPKIFNFSTMENLLETKKIHHGNNLDRRIATKLDDRLDESPKTREKSSVVDEKNSIPKKTTPRKGEKKNEAFFESPGSSNPTSFYSCSRYSNEYYDETQIFEEIDKASEFRCESPPASVSILENPSREILEETLNDPSDESTFTSEFYKPESRSILFWSPSESFVSVDEEYTYEDEEKGVAFIERHLRVLPATSLEDMDRVREEASWIDRLGELSIVSSETSARFSVTSSVIARSGANYDKVELREKLRSLGEAPGPITQTTFNVYLKRLWRLEHRKQRESDHDEKDGEKSVKNYLKERIVARMEENFEDDPRLDVRVPEFLLETDWTEKREFYRNLEEKSFSEYSVANPKRKYRGGVSRTSFCYLLLDPRITRDLPRCGGNLSLEAKWRRFLEAVFYVGKGKAARPIAHLYDAFGIWCNKRQSDDPGRKIRRILEIWENGLGVVCLHVFSHSMTEEACTREAAMIEALGTSHLTNSVQGTYYGYAATMSSKEKRALGKFLLYKSMEILMFEGERQLFPRNVVL